MSISEAPHSSSDPNKPHPTRARWIKPLAGVAFFAAAWTGIVGHWLPGWARGKAEAAATQALGTPVRMGQIRIKPWTLEVGIDALSVGPKTAPWLTLAHADAQVSLESIWRLAPVVRHITLDQPMFWLNRQGSEQFNISAVMAHLREQAKQSKQDNKPTRFAIFNIQVKDGLVRYTDQVLHQEHRAEHMQLGIPFVSNLPSYLDAQVQPQFKADIDGSPLSFDGQTLPFKEGLHSEVKLNWHSVDVAHWLQAAQPFLPPDVHLLAQQGKLDTALRVQFAQGTLPAVPTLIIQGSLKLSQLDFSQKQVPGLGDTRTQWDTLQIEGLDTQPLLQQVTIRSMALDGLSFKAVPGDATGGSAPSTPAAKQPTEKTAETTPPVAANPWQWSLNQLHVGASHMDVQTSREAAWPTLSHLALNAKGLSSSPKASAATWQLNLSTAEGTELKLDGQTHIHQQSTQVKLSLSRASIPAWLAPLKQALHLPLQIQRGELGFQGQITANLQAAEAGIHLREGVLQIKGLQTQAAAKGSPDKINLAALQLDDIDIELPMPQGKPELRSIQMSTLTLDQLDARVTRGPQGQWLGMATPQASPTPSPAAANKAKAAALPPVTLKLLHCQACRVQLTNQSTTPYGVVDLQQADLNIQGISSDLSRALNIKLATRAQGKGTLSFDGEVRPQPLQVKAKLGVTDLDLRVLQPYLEPTANVALASANAQVDGRLSVQNDAKAGLSARYLGRLGLSDLRVLDRVNNADLLSWRQLKLEGSDLSWSPTTLKADLGKISLQEFYGRFIINPDGKVNLSRLIHHPDDTAPQSLTTPKDADAQSNPPVAAPATAQASAAATAPVAAAASSARPTAPEPAMNLRWQSITLAKGKVDFTDNFIKPNYSAKLIRIEGTISGVASNKPEPATVSVTAAVDDGTPLQISGQLHPLGPQLYTDISASAKGIELTRLSTYASRYAGYAIDKGTLSMNVHYKVDGGKLAAENQIYLDQLTFGDKNNNPDATSLPVKLAVALLKNSKGEIDIDLPVSGSLDDPQFSVGGIIWKVILNLIGKAVTAPFALLSGSGGDELGFVPFPAGSATLDEAARKRLDTLGSKLKDRPSLKLEATGRADPSVDAEGLREAHVLKLVVAAKAKATDEDIDAVTIAPEEKEQWLNAAYQAADIKKPRNLVGVAKTLSSADMNALLKATAPTGPDALKALANQRGNVVKAYLAERISAERVLLTASKIGLEGLPEDKGPSTRVQFDIR